MTQIKLPNGLLKKILSRIHKEQRILVLKRVILFSLASAVSGLAFLPSLMMLLSDFSQSGFIQFFSLAFSDFSAVLMHWQSFAMILLETLPAVSLALFLAVLLAFLESLKLLSKNVKNIIKFA